MKILVTAAEQQELDCAIRAYDSVKDCISNTIAVDFHLTGIGATQACYTVTSKLVYGKMGDSPYNVVMNIGIAGSYNLNLFPIGSAAIIGKEYFGDLGFEYPAGYRDLFKCNCLDPNGFPYTNGALERKPLPYMELENALAGYKTGTGVTVQTVTGNKLKIADLCSRYSPHIESMEGAAVYYAALMENVPFFELRTVSNEVGEQDPGKWETEKALHTLERCCKEIFSVL